MIENLDLFSLFTKDGTQSVLLVVVAWFLKSSVALLTKIYTAFISIDSKLASLIMQNEKIIIQGDTMNEKLINLQAHHSIIQESIKNKI
jgi:hypothetical protein